MLLVDDNADMRAYLTRLLADHVAVRTAANGVEALAAVRERAPDLVLSDVMMPEIDGIELVRRLRGEPGLEALPIVMLTAAGGSEATSQGLDVGADDYLVKPFTADDLVTRVTARLTAGRERRLRQTLQELAGRLATCQDPLELLEAVHPVLHRWCGADTSTLAVVDAEGALVRLWHVPGFGSGVDERYRTGVLATSEGPLFDAIRTATQVVLDGPEQMASQYPATAVDLGEVGVVATVATPIALGVASAGGCLGSAWREPHPLHEDDLELHRRFAAVVDEAVQRMQAAAREHRLVDEFQAQLLEVDHRVPTAVVAALYRPAERSLLVGGDWYDVISLTDGSLGVSVGDVVGKGLPAATAMSQLRSSLRVAASTSSAPADVLDVVDRHARRVRGAMCASAIYLRLTPSGEINWTCAGHPPPLVVIGDEVRFLHGGRRSLLGYGGPVRRRDGREELPPGSLVLMYTDGLVERRGESLDVGLRRLADAVREHRRLSTGQLCDAVLAAMGPTAASTTTSPSSPSAPRPTPGSCYGEEWRTSTQERRLPLRELRGEGARDSGRPHPALPVRAQRVRRAHRRTREQVTSPGCGTQDVRLARR